jgi:ATP-binding cassette, subfamily G (WHITE), member 2, SNQ2
VTLFKRGSKAEVIKEAEQAVGNDEEKAQARQNAGAPMEDDPEARRETEEAIIAQPKMKDIFSWQHIDYTVPVSGGHRKLLDNVSGYVVPGKLTALMGESGAGKTTLLNVLAERTGTGVIRGDRFVNGQPLPPDFQAQTYVYSTQNFKS